MTTFSAPRRRWIASRSSLLLAALAERASGSGAAAPPFTLLTFGDSVLDCGRYNAHGVHPGQLLVRNDNALFPEFKGRDLQSRGAARLQHRAVDGATVADLPAQARGIASGGRAVALLTIGGNDRSE